jgi:hypothetical protein
MSSRACPAEWAGRQAGGQGSERGHGRRLSRCVVKKNGRAGHVSKLLKCDDEIVVCK